MIESIENGIQLLLTGFVVILSVIRALRSRRREWTLLALFAGSYFLGDLYWLLFLLFYGSTPRLSYVPDMSWYASFLFLFLLLFYSGEKRKRIKNKLLWLIPVFTIGMCIFYMQWGAYVSNLIYAVLMTLILWRIIEGLLFIKQDEGDKSLRWLYLAALLFCVLEYGMWTVSCFFESGSLLTPYFWLDVLLSVAFLLFIPAVRKAVDR